MKNLMTHKFAFGVLMMFVLAFGVQGTVEAQTVSVSGDGSVTSASAGTTVILVGSDPSGTPLNRFFNIAVNGVKGTYNPSGSISGVTRTAHSADTLDITLTGATFASTNPRVLPTALNAATFSSPTLTFVHPASLDTALANAITASTSTTPGQGDGQVTVSTAEQNAINAADAAIMNWRGSGTIRVNYSVAAYGEFSITVDPSWDNSPNSTKEIKAYVARANSQSAQAGGAFINADSTNTTTTPRTASGPFSVLLSPPNQYTQVNFTISGGKFVESSGSYFSGNKLFTLSAVKEFTSLSKFTNASGVVTANVQPNQGQIATVTASVPGSGNRAATYKVTYFSSAITVEKDTDDNRSGDNQFGPAQVGSVTQRRAFQKQLVVRVTDGYGNTKGVGGQWVEFEIQGITTDPRTDTSNPWLRSVSRGLLWDRGTGGGAGDGHVNDADDNFPNLVVKTDGSGYAKVHFVPGDNAGSYTVRYRVVDQTSHTTYNGTPSGTFDWQSQTFTATVEQSNTSSYVINKVGTASTTTPQLRNNVNLTPMTVNVQDGGADIANARVEFSVDGGRIALSNSNPNYQNRLSAVTDSNGDATVYVQTNSGSTAVVTAQIAGTYTDEARHVVTYFSEGATLRKVSGDNQKGALGGRLDDPLVVEVLDGTRPVADQIVMFDAQDATDPLLAPLVGAMYDIDLTAAPLFQTADGSTDERNDPLYIKTDSNGQASAHWVLATGTAGSRSVVVNINGLTANAATRKTFTATAETAGAAAALEIVEETNSQSTLANGNLPEPLKVRVRDIMGTGRLLSGVSVRFTTTKGTLSIGTGTPDTVVTGTTDRYGEVEANYNIGDASGTAEVVASIATTGGIRRTVTFTINGTGSSGPTDTPTTSRPSLSLSTSTLRGSPGQQQSFIVYARNASGALQQNVLINLSSGINISGLPSSVISGQSVSITLPNSNTFITASTGTHGSQRLTVTVQAVPAEIVKVSGDSPVQTGEPGAPLPSAFVVRVDDRNNNPVSGQTVTFRVTGGGGNFSGSTSTTATTDSSGQARATLTLGSAAGTNTVEASVGTLPAETFTATARARITRLQIDNGNNQIGEVNRALDQDLSVRLVDQDLTGIPRQLVTFRTVEGSGRFSPSDNVRTDSRGYATVTFTPSSAGSIEIEAASGTLSPVTFTITTGEPPDALVYISGNNQTGSPGARLANPFVVEVIDENDDPVEGAAVTFAVTAGGGSLSVTSVTTNGTGRAQTYLRLGEETGDNTVVARVLGLTDRITFKATSGAEVLVGAAQRPPMYWISRADGKLHRLVDAEVENLAPNIDNILSLTVDTQNQLLYWTRQTAESRSAIQRAGLNGKGVITLQTSLTLMTSIAVNNTGTTLYWADILGKIKSRPVQGNRVTLLAQNLSSPTGLVWSNDYLYWGEATGQIRRMNLRNNRRTIETITTSSGEPVSLAVQSGRVYWTEISGNAAQLNRVNTNGTGVEALKTLVGSRRVWIDVDGSDSKIYLTRASKLERRGLSGRSTVNLVTGLASPGSLVLGGELVATPPVVSQPTQPAQPAQPTVASKYDINQDGSVNNADTRAVAGAVGQSGAAITNPRTDVDGSGTVDVTDLILVIANLDADVAAPTIDIDLKALDLDFDRVQEQVEVLLASGDRSIAAQRALLYLQHLLASARPDETVLLANYPNPFNPETWIPYHLAESTNVRVNIYDAQGTLVRVLVLGHQTAGYYTSRSRAAYWDGLNALGERVASGIYFYQLQTDAVSPMRKMVILK